MNVFQKCVVTFTVLIGGVFAGATINTVQAADPPPPGHTACEDHCCGLSVQCDGRDKVTCYPIDDNNDGVPENYVKYTTVNDMLVCATPSEGDVCNQENKRSVCAKGPAYTDANCTIRLKDEHGFLLDYVWYTRDCDIDTSDLCS